MTDKLATQPANPSFWFDAHARLAEIQAAIPRSDTSHPEMFEISPCKEWVTIYWGGYAYQLDIMRMTRPEDLLW